jgi:arylsulfatase A-like enzyme
MRSRLSSGVLVLAVWFGLMTGLLEGAGLLAAQKLGWLEWETLQRGVAPDIVWIACVVDVLLFGTIGLILVAMHRVFPRLSMLHVAVSVFAFLAFADLIALTDRILIYAVVMLAAGLAMACVRWFANHEEAAMRFWRGTVGLVATGAALAFAGIHGGYWLGERVATARLPTAPGGVPNILVIVVDTLRADHLSSYGYRRATSPNLDRLAQQGVLFENAFSESSWTAPSHATILTGRHPREHKVEWNSGLDDRYPTIPEVLRRHGYRTAAFTGNSDWFSRRVGFGRGFMHFEDYFYSGTDMFVRTVVGRMLAERSFIGRVGVSVKPRYHKERRRAPIINSAAVRWVRGEADRPFFLFVNYYDVHEPYEPVGPYRQKFAGHSQSTGGLNVDAYDGEIGYVDEYVGRLVEEVEALRRDRPLLVVITSDHGESIGDHGFYLHANSLYLNEIHVPLIVRWPGTVPSGVRLDAPVTNATIPATLMELIGGGDQLIFPGSSLVRAWKNEAPASDRDYTFAEIARQPFAPEKLPAFHGWTKSIVTPEWHYMEHEKFGSQLYRWRADRAELNDLSKRPDLQGTLDRFREQLRRGGADEGRTTLSRRE